MERMIVIDILLALILGIIEFAILYRCETYFKSQKKHPDKTPDMICYRGYVDKDVSFPLKTACGKIHWTSGEEYEFEYCPYCGKKVDVVRE